MQLPWRRYAHVYTYLPQHPDYAAAWPTILADAGRIIDRVTACGIVVSGPAGLPWPLLDPYQGIVVNGEPEHHLDHDAFTLPPPYPPTTRRRGGGRGVCVTDRNPYDVAVCAILLRCMLLIPSLITVASTGGWDGEWAHGATTAKAALDTAANGRQLGRAADVAEPATQRPRQALGPGSRWPHSARGIVAELFGLCPVASPLRPRRTIRPADDT